ncbi:MAG TPA: class II aldolase/adducin family protein [Burkholderiales bacterium]|nr:class II aldolase/adducin family protein [Burkholderiales bacterium]
MSRIEMLKASRRLSELGLNRGASGNLSLRTESRFLVTPSALPPEIMKPEDVVLMDFDGNVVEGQRPSSEWRFHRDILFSRPEFGAVVHVHSPFATTLACLGMEIPPFHYMIAAAGGTTIRCAPYALFGTQALSDHALAALQDRRACLLANHGMIAAGRDLEEAMGLAVEVESLCEQYWRAIQVRPPNILSGQQMEEVLEKFKGYWRR